MVKKSSLLEKAINFLSLGAIIAGIVLGNYGITGNVVGETSRRFIGGGISFFVLGLLGVFIVNRGK